MKLIAGLLVLAAAAAAYPYQDMREDYYGRPRATAYRDPYSYRNRYPYREPYPYYQNGRVSDYRERYPYQSMEADRQEYKYPSWMKELEFRENARFHQTAPADRGKLYSRT